jgi:hypothetical protein
MDHEFEPTRPLEGVGREPAEEPVGEFHRPVRLASLQREGPQSEVGVEVTLAPRVQRRGVLETALLPSEVGQSHERLSRQSGTRCAELSPGLGELRLGLLPAALPDEHAGVLGPALTEQDADPVLLAELGHPHAPLTCSVVVADLLAGGDEVAAGPGDAREQVGFAAQRQHGRLVETVHAVLEVTREDQRLALRRQTDHLELRHLVAAPQGGRLRTETTRRRRVLEQEQRRLVDGQPPMIRSGRLPLQQPAGPLEPTVRDRGIAAELEMVGRQPRCHARCRSTVTPLPVRPVGGLAGDEGAGILVEEVVRPPEALPGFG